MRMTHAPKFTYEIKFPQTRGRDGVRQAGGGDDEDARIFGQRQPKVAKSFRHSPPAFTHFVDQGCVRAVYRRFLRAGRAVRVREGEPMAPAEQPMSTSCHASLTPARVGDPFCE